jgi:hypothetical protein
MEKIIDWVTFESDEKNDTRLEKQVFMPIGIKDGTLYVLDGLFQYWDGMKWVTMSLFEKMNEDLLDDRKDNYDDDTLKDFWMQAVADGNCEDSLQDYIEQIKDEDDWSMYYDNSYQWKDWYEKAVEQVKKIEDWEDTEFFDCVWCGRSWETWMSQPEYWDNFLFDGGKDILCLCEKFENDDN